MAEGRMLKKRMSKSKKFAALKSDRARMLYLLLYPHTDIKGRLEADPDLIKSQIVPRLSISEQQIMEHLKEMASLGLILLWKNQDDLYLEITRFADFQSLREDREAPSHIKDPTKEQLQEFCGIDTGELPPKDKLSKVNISKDKSSKDKEASPLAQLVDGDEELKTAFNEARKFFPKIGDWFGKQFKQYGGQAVKQNRDELLLMFKAIAKKKTFNGNPWGYATNTFLGIVKDKMLKEQKDEKKMRSKHIWDLYK